MIQRWRGSLPALKSRVGRVGRALFARQQNVLYEATVSDPLPEARTAVAVQVKIAGGRELAEIESFVGAVKAREFYQRIERGETCLVGRAGGQVASYVWLTCRDHRDAELCTTIPVDGGKCVGYDAFTFPDARGLGIRQRLHVEERKYCRAVGRSTLVFWLNREVESLAIRKWNQMGLHQTPVARITTYRLLRKFRFSRVRDLPSR